MRYGPTGLRVRMPPLTARWLKFDIEGHKILDEVGLWLVNGEAVLFEV